MAAAAISGCGSATGGSIAASGEPQPHGTMAIAVPSRPQRVDPLLATTPVDRLVAAQLFEPLTRGVVGPYDDVRRIPGLALSARPAERGRLWRIQLRPDVRFQDGSPLDASAVVANAERWRTTAAGRSLLPGLVAADAPRPDLVRLIVDRPLPNLRSRLASPRLAIVSPRELAPRSGTAASLAQLAGSGTGPFELRSGAGANFVLARNTGWWGTSHGLGPALDQVELRVAPSVAERARLLRQGEVQAAWGLPATVAAKLHDDPLLTGLVGPPGASIGLERSVRGIAATAPSPALSSVWLTRIGAE
jgi:peptide/nickel transport system substrate-binding protein